MNREAFRFFSDMNGVVGEHAVAGLQLARAEAEAEARGWTVEWVNDDDPDLSWCQCYEDRRDGTRVIHDHEVLIAYLGDSDGKILGCICGITDPDRNYRRLIEAELALEALADEKAAPKPTRGKCCSALQEVVHVYAHTGLPIGHGEISGSVHIDAKGVDVSDGWNALPPIVFNFCPFCGTKQVD